MGDGTKTELEGLPQAGAGLLPGRDVLGDEFGAEAFAVIREAMRKRDMVGLARVVLYGRERIIMLEPRGKGLAGTTLHYNYEVRDDKTYFDDIKNKSVAKYMLDLASHIIDTKVG